MSIMRFEIHRWWDRTVRDLGDTTEIVNKLNAAKNEAVQAGDAQRV